MTPYHGAIEHNQAEIKIYLDRWSRKAISVDRMVLLTENTAHDLGYQFQFRLGGKAVCWVRFRGPRMRYPMRKWEGMCTVVLGTGCRGIYPGRNAGHNAGGGRCGWEKMITKGIDQSLEVGEGVTRFLFGNGPLLPMSHMIGNCT